MVATRKIITRPEEIRKRIHSKILDAMRGKFPIEGKFYTASIKDAYVEHKPLSHTRQKKIKMSKGNASDALFCTLEIKDNTTGKVVHTINKHRLVNIPYFTDRFSFVIDGNEYNVVNQLRTKSGVYTRKRGNDELESSFNLTAGANFKLIMDPDTGKFSMSILHSKLPLLPVLKMLGATPGEIKKSMGDELYAKNQTTTASAKTRVVDTLYKKLLKFRDVDRLKSGKDMASQAEKERALRDYFDGTELSEETTKLTLGQAHGKVGKTTLLQAVEKMLRVFQQEEDVDDRDNLEFQKVFGPEDIISEVLKKSTGEVRKIKSKLDSFNFRADAKPGTKEATKKFKQIFTPAYFTKPLKNFISTSSISRLTDQINPLEIMQNSALVTRLGEGAISSEQAVPEETRSVNYSYLGTIDPVMSPESSKIGIDNYFAIGAVKGDDNEIYKEVKDIATGKLETKRVIDLYNKKVGFPDPRHLKEDQKKDSDKVSAVLKGDLVEVTRKDLDYQIPDTTAINSMATNNIPFINANQGNRILMAAKHQSQAMPLKERDARVVEPMLDIGLNHSISRRLGDFLLPKSPVDGTVDKVTDEFIHVRGTDGKEYQVDYAQNLPLASKTMLHNNVTVQPGTSVKKDQALGDNNFTKDGKLALGRNLKVAYMPYKGYNHEDGVVISEAASKKLTSMHSEMVKVTLDKTVTVDKTKFVSAFPTTFSKAQLAKIGPDGIAKKGVSLVEGDPIVLVLGDASESRTNQVLGRLHKSLMRNFSDQSEIYEGADLAKVIEVHAAGKHISVLVAKEKKAKKGDKICGSYGNKGVVTMILPDDKMPQGEDGEPVDAILTPAGTVGRVNPAQQLETALGKVALKTGKPYKIESYGTDDYVGFVRNELKKHKVAEKETITDPETGRKIPGIFTGIQHTHKMHKTTDTNFAARGVLGGYDQDDAPVGSGTTGPKALGGMEVNALLSHNARNLLRESTMLRSSKNQEFWNNYQYGGMAQFPTEKPTFDKFLTTLKQAGINVTKERDTLVAAPLTDKDIIDMSAGEIKNAKRVNSKNVTPEAGGLFDENITGGLGGTRWAHIDLAEPVVNPVFEDCIAALLEIPRKEVKQRLRNDGGEALKKKLNSLNIGRELTQLEKDLNNPAFKGLTLDKKVRKRQYLKALQAKGLKPGDAYMLTKFPVTPPKMRPISVGKTGDLMENDANEFYKDLILTNNEFKETSKLPGFTEEKKDHRLALQAQVDAVTGMAAPTTQSLKNKNAKGAIRFIAGDQPKKGFFQRKAIYSKMNLSGRATITPDQTLGLDEVGIPIDMAWSLYQPFILRKLSGMGYSAIAAKEEVENRSDTAQKILEEELEKRPAIINRAPTLWKHGIIAAKPQLRTGKNVGVNTLWESGTNADFDGDSIVGSIVARVMGEGKISKSETCGLTTSENMAMLEVESEGKISPRETNLKKGIDNMPISNIKIRSAAKLIDLEDFPRIEESKRVEGNIERYDVPSNVEVLSVMDGERAWLPVTEYSVHKNLLMKKVGTNSKRAIYCSADDSLITVDENMHYCKTAPELGLTIPRLLDPLEIKDKSQLVKTVPAAGTDLVADADLGWISGAFTGDGWLDNKGESHNAVMVCKDNVEFQNKWKSVIRGYVKDQHFTEQHNHHDYDGHASVSVKLTSYNEVFKTYFKENFTHTAAKKSLPHFWADTSDEFRWGLLAGLVDSDGSVSVINAKAKKHPQLAVTYTTINKSLIFEISALADTLGLSATPYFAKHTTAGNQSWGVTFNTASVAILQEKLCLYHSKKRDALTSFKIRAATIANTDVHTFTPRLTTERLTELRKSIPGKRVYKRQPKGYKGPKVLAVPEAEAAHWNKVNSVKVVLSRLIKNEEVMTRSTAKSIIALDPACFADPESAEFWAQWKAMVEDDSIVWELVTSVRPVPEITEAYDITAPPNFTMVTSSGFVVQDTMTVHLPITDEAIEETKKMFPSQIVFSDKKPGDLIMAPSQEPITGLYKATQNLGTASGFTSPKKFKTEADAWKAYHAGTLKMTDPVSIG